MNEQSNVSLASGINNPYIIENNLHGEINSIVSSSASLAKMSAPIDSDILYKTIVYSLTIPLFILTTAGNGVILITIRFQARLLSSSSNYFILSLAFADFLVGVAIMPIMIVFTANSQKWIFSNGLIIRYFFIFFFLNRKYKTEE
jgi:hypothetical protein